MSEVVVKSNADIRALTYCDLKVQLNPTPAKTFDEKYILVHEIIYIYSLSKLFIWMILTWAIIFTSSV